MSFDAWRLRLPLAKPYRLAFGPVEALDTLLVRATLDDGTEGFGEATLLTGYTDETIEGAWEKACEVVRDPRLLDSLGEGHPFLTTAFRTALEMAAGSRRLSLEEPCRVPILGLLQGETPYPLDTGWVPCGRLSARCPESSTAKANGPSSTATSPFSCSVATWASSGR